MGGKREKPEDIVLKLRQVEVLQGQGKPLADAVHQIGDTAQTYYRWRQTASTGLKPPTSIPSAWLTRIPYEYSKTTRRRRLQFN